MLSMPGQWLWLLGQRAFYLFGLKRDVWALPPQGLRSGPIGSYSLLDAAEMVVFAIGLLLILSRIRRGQLSEELTAAVLMLACVMVPPLLIFGSKRFIIPVIPLIALFQAYAFVIIARVFLGLRNRSDRYAFARTIGSPVQHRRMTEELR